MLIECTGCQAKIRVPDTAAGKRVKCPKCQAVISVPAQEDSPDSPPEPAAEPKREEGISSKPSSSGVKPPPVKQTQLAKSKWDYEEDEKPKSSKRRRDDDGEDEDDGPPKKRKRDWGDDDDRDDRKRRRKSEGANGLAMTSMIMGIIALVIAVPGCCCCNLVHILTLICAVTAVITGHMSVKSSSGGMALGGLICGYIAIALSLLGLVLFILSFFINMANFGVQGWQVNQGFNNPNFNNRFGR